MKKLIKFKKKMDNSCCGNPNLTEINIEDNTIYHPMDIGIFIDPVNPCRKIETLYDCKSMQDYGIYLKIRLINLLKISNIENVILDVINHRRIIENKDNGELIDGIIIKLKITVAEVYPDYDKFYEELSFYIPKSNDSMIYIWDGIDEELNGSLIIFEIARKVIRIYQEFILDESKDNVEN